MSKKPRRANFLEIDLDTSENDVELRMRYPKKDIALNIIGDISPEEVQFLTHVLSNLENLNDTLVLGKVNQRVNGNRMKIIDTLLPMNETCIRNESHTTN